MYLHFLLNMLGFKQMHTSICKLKCHDNVYTPPVTFLSSKLCHENALFSYFFFHIDLGIQ